MDERSDVPIAIVAELRALHLGLPEVVEEQAWVGTRWRIRCKTFAHVLRIDSGWPPAYSRAAGSAGPVNVLMVRSSGSELDALGSAGHPFFRPPWPGVIGVVLDANTDWKEVTELLTEAYCLVAPKKLVDMVARPLD